MNYEHYRLIKELAEQAGFYLAEFDDGNEDNAKLQKFAALVAAHVRETEFKPDWNTYQQGLADGAAAEREACAKLCEGNADDLSEGDWDSACINCADSIRARSEV